MLFAVRVKLHLKCSTFFRHPLAAVARDLSSATLPWLVHANENHSICTYQSFDDASLGKSLDAMPVQEWLQRAHWHFLDTVRRLHTLITALNLLVIVAMPLARCCQDSVPAQRA